MEKKFAHTQQINIGSNSINVVQQAKIIEYFIESMLTMEANVDFGSTTPVTPACIQFVAYDIV